MNSGRILVNGSSFYCGNSTSSLCQLALKSDIPSVTQYVHPSTKQCNYVYTHPTTKQCNYAYTHPSSQQCSNVNATTLSGYTYSQILSNASANAGGIIRRGSVTWTTSSNSEYETRTVSFSGFSSTPAITAIASYPVTINMRSVVIGASVGCSSINTSSASFTILPNPSYENFFRYAKITLKWIAVG